MFKPIVANTLIAEPGMSDPHALVIDHVCYLFTGHDVGHGISDWVMPDWRIYRSENLVDWQQIGVIEPADNYMGAGNTQCWAGDIVAHKGKFYWYFSHGPKETGVMVADNPAGPYTDALGKPLVDSFDPDIFIEDDGAAYIFYGHTNYKAAKLKDSMIELATEPQSIVVDRQGVFPEMDKCSVHKHQGIYYLSCSGYYATAENLYGPYTYRGLVGEGWQLDSPFGHGDFFVMHNQWFHVWCRYRNRRQDRVRDCLLAPVNYDAAGKMYDDTSNIKAAQGGY